MADRRVRMEELLLRVEACLLRCIQTLGSREGRDDAGGGAGEVPGSSQISPDASRQRASEPRGGRSTTGVRSILIVDRDAPSRAALGDLLDASGYPVVEVGSSDDLTPDDGAAPLVIVFDPGPHMDAGLRTVARMRVEQCTPAVPVVLLSAVITPEQRDRGTAIGCSAVLVKPRTPADLLSTISRLVELPSAAHPESTILA